MSKWTRYYDTLIQDELLKTVLDNGLEILVLKKPGFIKKYGYFGTRYGSFYQCFNWQGEEKCMPTGIAHFLEHKIFESKEGNLFDTFAMLGAHVNAYTSYNSTFYHFNTNSNFDECLKILMHFVQRIELTEENVEKEKGIIVQELKSYEDETEYMAYFKMMSGLYTSHPVSQDVGGTIDDVMKITKEQLETCYHAFYSPKNMMIFAAGDLDEEEVYNIVVESLTSEFNSRKAAEVKTISEDHNINEHSQEIFNAEIQMPYFTIGFKGPNDFYNREDKLLKLAAIRVMMDSHFGRGSKLYNELYDQNLINTSFGVDFAFGEGYSLLVFDGESNEPEKVCEAIKNELKNCLDVPDDEDAFNRVKKKMLGRLIAAGNSVQYMSSAVVSNYMKNINTMDNTEAYMKSIPEDAKALIAEIFALNCTSLVIAKPFEKE